MTSKPWSRAWGPAVGPRLDRGVRPRVLLLLRCGPIAKNLLQGCTKREAPTSWGDVTSGGRTGGWLQRQGVAAPPTPHRRPLELTARRSAAARSAGHRQDIGSGQDHRAHEA